MHFNVSKHITKGNTVYYSKKNKEKRKENTVTYCNKRKKGHEEKEWPPCINNDFLIIIHLLFFFIGLLVCVFQLCTWAIYKRLKHLYCHYYKYYCYCNYCYYSINLTAVSISVT